MALREAGLLHPGMRTISHRHRLVLAGTLALRSLARRSLTTYQRMVNPLAPQIMLVAAGLACLAAGSDELIEGYFCCFCKMYVFLAFPKTLQNDQYVVTRCT